jgi:hypothetical protein
MPNPVEVIEAQIIRGSTASEIAKAIADLAEQHEEGAAEIGMALGDLQDLLAEALCGMTPAQRLKWFKRPLVQSTLKVAAGLDPEE